MKDQKTLKAQYMNIISTEVWPKSPDMIKYADKKAAWIVEINNGDIVEIEKPSIDKNFCFGYGYCGVSTDEDYRGAANLAAHARTSTDYFIAQNMEPLDRWLKDLEDLGTWNVYKRPNYLGQQESCKLMNIHFKHEWDYRPEDGEELTPEEIQAVIEGYKEVKKQFKKRLDSYLKRYGLSKVHSWTFLSD